MNDMNQNLEPQRRHRFIGLRLALFWIVTLGAWYLFVAHSGLWAFPAIFAYLIRPETAAECAARMRQPASFVFGIVMLCVLIGIWFLPHTINLLPVYYGYLAVFFGFYFILDIVWFGYLPIRRSNP